MPLFIAFAAPACWYRRVSNRRAPRNLRRFDGGCARYVRKGTESSQFRDGWAAREDLLRSGKNIRGNCYLRGALSGSKRHYSGDRDGALSPIRCHANLRTPIRLRGIGTAAWPCSAGAETRISLYDSHLWRNNPWEFPWSSERRRNGGSPGRARRGFAVYRRRGWNPARRRED